MTKGARGKSGLALQKTSGLRTAATNNKRHASNPERPERTREHYIASICRNHVERFIIHRGHTVYEPIADYGYDIVVNTYDYKNDPDFMSGEIENGSIFI